MNDTSGFIQAIRGPIMLIVLGTLVAVDYAGIFAFWRTWPILIIVFGILKLLEKATSKPLPPPDYPGPYAPGAPGARPPGGNVI
jgi:hypothetical protein